MRCDPVDRVVLVSDPFRLDWNNAGGGDWNVFVLQKLAGKRLRSVAPWWSCTSETVLSGPAQLHPDRVYPLLDWPVEDTSWARLYAQPVDKLPTDLERMLEEAFDGALVVGFEMPPFLREWLAKRGQPWINLSVHPVRFLPDLLWSVSTNDEAIREMLGQFKFSSKRIEREVAKRRRRAGPVRAPADAAIVIGQVGHDRSRIAEGRFWSLEEFAAELETWCAGRPLVFKPHPLGAEDSVGESWLLERGAQLVDDNIYDLLAADGDRSYAALSSSVLTEAKCFGRDARRLMPESDDAGGVGAVTVGGVIFERAFWSRVAQPVSSRRCRPWPRLSWLVPSDASRRLVKKDWGWKKEGGDSS